MTQPAEKSSRTIAVEHIRIASGRPFAEVRVRLEATVPKLDVSIGEALQSGDQRAKEYDENGPKLSIFGERDHGAPCCRLQAVGATRCNMTSANPSPPQR
jgi:hypothetical protein